MEQTGDVWQSGFGPSGPAVNRLAHGSERLEYRFEIQVRANPYRTTRAFGMHDKCMPIDRSHRVIAILVIEGKLSGSQSIRETCARRFVGLVVDLWFLVCPIGLEFGLRSRAFH
jgi:hypothetical protein